MNRKLFSAGCLTAALFSNSAFAQEEPVEVRVRAIAKPDGKVEVVEERIVGSEQANPKKVTVVKEEEEETVKGDETTLRARLFRRAHDLTEKIAGAAAGGAAGGGEGEVHSYAAEDVWGEMPASDYWIGVQIAPVAPEIRKHMSVKHGVLVVHVYPDSPAVKAELKADDILIQAGDAKIETGPDLVKAIDAAKETELSFLVLREGKEQKITIAPKKREDDKKALAIYEKKFNAFPQHSEKVQEATKQLEKALATLRAENAEEGTVDLMLVRPGAFLARSIAPKMPDDLTIQITKEGNKPAKVQVKKGEKSWETTADKLDSLPDDIRPHVNHLMAGSTPHGALTLTAPMIEARLPTTLQMKVAPPSPAIAYPPTAVVPAPYTTRMPNVAKAPAVAAVPATPAVPGMPPAVARAATAWSYAVSPPQASDAKLDQILKKLDSLASPDLEDMKKELKALRKEVDELRKKAVER